MQCNAFQYPSNDCIVTNHHRYRPIELNKTRSNTHLNYYYLNKYWIAYSQLNNSFNGIFNDQTIACIQFVFFFILILLYWSVCFFSKEFWMQYGTLYILYKQMLCCKLFIRKMIDGVTSCSSNSFDAPIGWTLTENPFRGMNLSMLNGKITEN